ncbi:MAG: agmatinase [Methylobacteriaceae bacterium]|nr:agmatinase [Methylobacteriaceae bacterium]
MTDPPTFSLAPGFLGTSRNDRDAAICIAGIPFDIGTTNRSGARFGPHAIRQASRMLVDGAHPRSWVKVPALPLSDIGNFPIIPGEVQANLAIIEREAATIRHLIALGGDHSISLPLLRALAPRDGPLSLVHFDAHVDTWPDNFGQTHGHGSVFYHAIEEGLVSPASMVQVGIRSPVEKEIFDWTLDKGVTIITAEEVHESKPMAIARRIRAILGSSPTYLSFDIDVLDPAFAPGTGTPEIGGLSSWQAQSILRGLGGINLVGMDVVEVAPAYDVAEITALAAATMAWEYLALTATVTAAQRAGR